ncbi:MAG: xanthine dehydrogenase family protein molybdopterin-binding subunit [Paracoccaceae bacterium]|nr:MAG: xanthine dehydrogenase family protein molybdopterin-binding subunit [Paracoccaceae bacterium]
MQQFGKAQPAGRIEDHRFLTGQGRFVDDIAPEGALVAMFLRSPVAHGRILSLDLSAAQAMPGVHLVLDAAALAAEGVALAMQGMRISGRGGARGAGPERPVLAQSVLRHLGEPVAMVVADSAAVARDAVEAIVLDHAELAPALGLGGEGPAIHAVAPGNLAYDYVLGDEAAVAAALAAAHHRLQVEVAQPRVFAASMEPRGAFAEWDGERLHFCTCAQGVWTQKAELARMLGLPRDRVRVTNPDVGGGFGMKVMTYPEYVPLAQAARMLGRPVKWTSDRGEAMLADNGARDLTAVADLGFDADLRLTGYACAVRSNMGAYNSQFGQNIQSVLFGKVFTGIYDLPMACLTARGYYTSTTPVDAYRGAGRPEAILTIERAMDAAARVLGVSPFELRRRNAIRAFPHSMMNGETIRDGDFLRILDRLEAECDHAGFAARRAESAARGRLRGFGLASYIEAVLGDPAETARIAFDPDGTVTLFVGTQSNGQGHETVYTRLLSERTGIAPHLIRIVQGDSDAIPAGGGTGGSRSVTVQGSATVETVAAMVAAFAAYLADDMGDGVAFDGRSFHAPGTNLRPTLIEAAERARAAGRADLLSHERAITLAARSFPNGAHAAEVEIDPETGLVTLDRYTVTDDFGTMLAPELVEGQVHGGIAQGFGQTMTERVVFDGQGQLLTGSFMDYAMPRAADMPRPRFTTEPVPTATNPLGMKGCGEAGTVGALGALSNAVADALAQAGAPAMQMPFSPGRVWAHLREAQSGPV